MKDIASELTHSLSNITSNIHSNFEIKDPFGDILFLIIANIRI